MPKRRPRVSAAKRGASHPAPKTGPSAGRSKAELEALVQERTAALQAANAEAERRAREAKERHTLLQMILDHAPAGITVVGGPPDYPIVVNNRYALERLGRTHASLVGLPAGHHAPTFGLMRADGRVPAPEELPLYRATRDGEVIANEEWVIQRPDGTNITALCNVAPLRDAEGRIVGAVNCWRDITEQKRAEDARRLSDEKFRTAFRANPAGIVLSRLADGQILDANETFLRLFGYARKEALGHTSADLGMWGSPEERSLAVADLLRRDSSGTGS